jgi:threonyl-tRNA synthetase
MNEKDLGDLRHSLAHLLAAAVLDIYPDTKLTIGPAIDNGFYYDFDFSKPVTDDDLKNIQTKMRKTSNSWTGFSHEEVTADEARAKYKDNPYKLELIDEIEEKGEKITLYTSGGFTDLCRGGHIDDLSKIDGKSFELDRVAGAYWRGDENNKMLTRIYGLAFETKEDLDTYKTQREEAKKRDHRKIGKELGLFTFSELVGGGLPLFTPKGTAMRDAIVNKIQSLQGKHGYQKVYIPHITKPDLYKTSGHWDKFGDELFKVTGRESEFVMKPMNCPHHTQIFASEPRSYKDLPIRFMEATTCYRDEQSGELLGLSRARSFTQDDGHVFCTPEQIKDEIKNIVDVIKSFYTALGMWNEGDFKVFLSVRDPKNPEAYLGDDDIWNKSEEILKEIAEEEKLPYTREEGEAAFYGPKLDFKFKDAIGREWQLATAQLDFNMPKNFDLEYTDKDGLKKTPVMIHRAIAGSLERFLSVIIEHFAGNFPLWMAPVQIKVLPVAEAHDEVALEALKTLQDEGYRVEADLTDEGLGKKVRKAKVEKVPYFLIIGDKEVESKMFTLESRDKGNIGPMSMEELLELFGKEK